MFQAGFVSHSQAYGSPATKLFWKQRKPKMSRAGLRTPAGELAREGYEVDEVADARAGAGVNVTGTRITCGGQAAESGEIDEVADAHASAGVQVARSDQRQRDREYGSKRLS